MAEFREAVRNLDMGAGGGFAEGPVDARGMSGCSVVVESFPGTAPTTGVWEIVGGPQQLKLMQSFTAAETGTGAVFVPDVGGSATGVQHIGWLDAKVTTLQADKKLRFHFYLWE